MAGIIPSFSSGSRLIIHVGGIRVAYATNLSFTDNMALAPVSGIGSYNPDAIEPLQYMANGSMTIYRYSRAAWNAIAALSGKGARVPNRASGGAFDSERDGNSLLSKNSFSPVHLLISRTFDIDVYDRIGAAKDKIEGSLVFSIKDVRLTSYSMSFTPGTLVQEIVTFLALSIVDAAGESLNKKEV